MGHVFSTCHHSAATPTWSSQTFANRLRNLRDALRDAFVASRQYEHLKSRGVPHDTALRRVFGISKHNSGDPGAGANISLNDRSTEDDPEQRSYT
jgi:hypothetical protein